MDEFEFVMQISTAHGVAIGPPMMMMLSPGVANYPPILSFSKYTDSQIPRYLGTQNPIPHPHSCIPLTSGAWSGPKDSVSEPVFLGHILIS